MARHLIQNSATGDARIVGDSALPFFPGYAIVDTLEDGQPPSLFYGAGESDLRYVNVSELSDSESAASVAVRAAFGAAPAMAQKVVGRNWLDRWVDTYLDAPPAHDVPTITYTATDASPITSGVQVREARVGGVSTAALDVAGDPSFRYLGLPTDGTQAWGASPSFFVETLPLPGGLAQARKWDLNVEFETSAPEVALRCHVPGASQGPMAIWVNGRWVDDESIAGSAGSGTLMTKLVFPDARPRVIRATIVGGLRWGGVWASPGHPVKRTNYAIKRRVAVITDSIGTASGAPPTGGRLTDTIQYHLPYLMGADETIAAGIGGTKWVASGSGDVAVSHFGGGRLTDVLEMNPDVIVFFGSRNDTGGTQAALDAVQAAVETALDLCAAVPEVYVAGTVTSLPQNAAVKAGTLAKGRRFVDLNGLIYGTGKSGTPTGDGNADYFIGTDGVHPTLLGHRAITRRFYEGIADAFSMS